MNKKYKQKEVFTHTDLNVKYRAFRDFDDGGIMTYSA